MSEQLGFGLLDPTPIPPQTPSLTAVYARFERSEPFSLALFEGFSSLRVLTYSVSINAVIQMLHRFETMECVFGYEGVLQDFSDILACQRVISENLIVAIKELDDARKHFILERVSAGRAQFFVVRDAIAHSKIYLLEGENRRRVMVGSANLSTRAFSGKQAETLLIFDDDDAAWEHYQQEYEAVRRGATSKVDLPTLVQRPFKIEDVPLLQEVQEAPQGLTVFVHKDIHVVSVPTIINKVERLAHHYRPQVQALARAKQGRLLITREVVGKIVQLVRAKKGEEENEEATWFSINLETGKLLLSGEEVPLIEDHVQVKADVQALVEYFNNYERGFHGDVVQHQRDYFLFMAWLYLSPFICDLRNQAIADQDYIFDYPLFAILYGKSNCGKSCLIQTLMRSMFGHYTFMKKANFTRGNLLGLLLQRRRYPVVFDDVEKKRFVDHASDIIKDETFSEPEYPAFILSMNAEDHSFSTEIRKRCLILYTRASLPDNTEAARDLYRSVGIIQSRIGTALYHEYLRRVIHRLNTEPFPRDLLRFSSEVLVALFAESCEGTVPHWCAPMSMEDYQGRKYEKIQAELLKLYETSPDMWKPSRNEVVLRVPPAESFGLRKEIPDWLLKEGSKGGNIVLDRKLLEQFIGRKVGRRWWEKWRK